MRAGPDPVGTTLREYADRGVFRGLRAERGRFGRIEYRFLWLTPRPLSATYDPVRGVVSFTRLFPAVDSVPGVAAALRASVAARATRRVPAHRRLDQRRARIRCAVRRGDLSLSVAVRGRSHEYAMRHALNLINDLFLLLHETYPDYLVAQFGLSSE